MCSCSARSASIGCTLARSAGAPAAKQGDEEKDHDDAEGLLAGDRGSMLRRMSDARAGGLVLAAFGGVLAVFGVLGVSTTLEWVATAGALLAGFGLVHAVRR